MELFDSHCHLNDEKFDEDRDNVIKSIYKAGVSKIVNAGYDISSSKKAIDIAKKNEYIYCTVGISPNDVPKSIKEIDDQIKEIKSLLNNKKIVAIGEIGLDYYWNKENKSIQKDMFIKQIELANIYNLLLPIK